MDYGSTVFLLIEGRSQIQAGSLIQAGGSKDEYHRDNCAFPGISLCSNKYRTKNLGVLNTCSSVNQVVLIEAESLIQARSLIEAVGLTLLS